MKVNVAFEAIALLALTNTVTAAVDPLKFKIRSRQAGLLTREAVAKAPPTSIPITNSFANFDLQVRWTHLD